MDEFKLNVETPLDGAVAGSKVEFNFDQFRTNQDYVEHLAGRLKSVVIPVKRPDRQLWTYIHPDATWRAPVALVDDRIKQHSYLVVPSLLPEISGEAVLKMLVCYAIRQGSVGLWPIRLPSEDGRLDSYNESAFAIIREYSGKWIRVLTNLADKTYEVYEPMNVSWPAPEWPEGGLESVVEMAFKGRTIQVWITPY